MEGSKAEWMECIYNRREEGKEIKSGWRVQGREWADRVDTAEGRQEGGKEMRCGWRDRGME